MAAHALPRPGRRGKGISAFAGVVGTALTVLVTLLLLGGTAAVLGLHLGIRPVLSPSMQPTYRPGWAVVTRDVPVTSVRPGDIVVFTPPGASAAYAHRVVAVRRDGDGVVVETKGDANPTPDPWQARLTAHTVPRVVMTVPWLGRALIALRHPLTRAVVLAVIGLVVCVSGTRAIVRGSPAVRPSPTTG